MDSSHDNNSRSSVRLQPDQLRSWRWFGPDDLRSFGHRSRLKAMGLGDEDFRDKPVIAILNTWSDLNTCHSHLRQRAAEVREGVLQSGGFPVEVPVVSLGEMLMKPSTMLYRNLLAMETEEVLRCHPIDAAVLLGGCDKTVPAMLMGAISADIPSIFLPAGPMLTARWRNQTLGSGVDVWKYWAERRAGQLCDESWQEIEDCIGRSAGTCMTMGTASTMASIAETLGMSLPGAAATPAVLAEHSRLARATGRRAVGMAWEDLKPSRVLTDKSFDNAVVADLAIGGSTNAIVHLIALARRAGTPLTLDRFDELSRATPVVANIRPCVAYHPFIPTHFPRMDVVVVRENEEDTYGGIEHQQTQEVAQCLKLITWPGSLRLCRYAFAYARAHGRKRVTSLVKDNIMKQTDGLFRRAFEEAAEDYPEIESDVMIIDMGAARLASRPNDFDVVVAPNLYGDIISDITAEVAGAVGLVGTANIGPDAAMFEAIHGSA
ncbi:MAG: isocitrate/isopropylmalate family dehydrogenase, partial [Planctomycetota bacterium]